MGTVTPQSSGTVAAGKVISESPLAGTLENPGTAVNLVVSTGPVQVAVPNVVGLTQAAATSAITGAGLTVGTVTPQSSGTVAAGKVISESPLAGTLENPGTAVNLVVSTGPAQVAVPNVVGLTQAAATNAITGAGLTVGTVTPQSSGTVATGKVISESPLAGTLENPGTAVNLVVSTGPAQVAVPNVVGLTQAAATNAITGAGLTVGTVTPQSSGTVAAGKVISESPLAGTLENPGTAVNLVVSTGPAQVAVPNVVGLTQAAATSAITGAGLTVGTVTPQSSGTVAAGKVISESPLAGTLENPGTAVNLVVSTGPVQVAVPNVVGLTQAAATSAITGAGLTVGTITPQSSSTVAAGKVISESPLAGTLENPGTAVNLVVSTGSVQVLVPTSISVILSDNLLGPDGTTTASPTVFDQNGNPMSNPAFQFTVTVVAQGKTSGNAPVVNGFAVQFPKVVKTLINENPTFDPTGQFASTDPNDPNFGLDTGGLFVVKVGLVGTQIAGSAPVIVLPSGTASLTVGLKQYNDQLGKVLSEAMVALQNNDLVAVAKAQSDLQTVQGNSLFSFDVLSTNNVVIPPDGFPASPAQMVNAGFSNGPDDAAYNATLGSLLTTIQQAQASVDAINPAAMTQADIDTLQQAANNYTSLTQQLAALSPSSLAVTQNASNLNAIMTVALPQLLDSMSAKSSAILLQVNPTASASIQYLKYLRSRRSGANCRVPHSGGARLQPARFSPEGLPQRLLQERSNGRTRELPRLKKAQFVNFFFTAFSIFTDLRGSALKNIITLSISLANDLLNIEAANIINAQSTGALSIDFVQASSSFSFACPNYSPTTIDGTDFSQDPSRMKVALLGCINSSLIASLATLKVPKDLAAAIRLIGKITSIVKDLGRNEGPAALVIPDSVQPGIFDPDVELVFANGWPRVNQGTIPCVGLVIVFNLDDGSFAATNIDVLGVCN